MRILTAIIVCLLWVHTVHASRIKPLLSSPQTVTASWVDVGGEIVTDGHKDIAFWIKLTINDSNNVQFRALAKHIESHADEYEILTETYSAGVNTEDATVHELNADANQKVKFDIDLHASTPVIQLQVKALTVGATGATIDEVKYDED